MAQRLFYLDTCIWRDYFEDRNDGFRPIGRLAWLFLKRFIAENKGIIICSDLVEEELMIAYPEETVGRILSVVPQQLLKKVAASKGQVEEAVQLSRKHNVPKKDALHAVIARDCRAVLITRDRHFSLLSSVVCCRKPEDFL